MDTQPQHSATKTSGGNLVGFGVAAGFVLLVLLVGDQRLMARQLWMDEIHSWLIATDPDISHSLRALENGADFNPPTYYLLLRVFLKVSGESFAGMRWFSLLSMAAGLGLVAAILRRTHSTAVVVAACSVVAIQPLVIQQATEARFYALWFALAAAFCFLRSRPDRSLASLIAEGIVAAVICTTHYFGIISLALVFLAEACGAIRGKRVDRSFALKCVPYGAGVLAVAGCFGFYLGQRSVLTVPTWVSPPTLLRARVFIVGFIPVLLLALAGVFALMFRRRETSETRGGVSAGHWLLLATCGMPVVLVLFSYLIQPAMVDRYAIVSMLAWAPAFALLLKNSRREVLVLFVVLCGWFGVNNVRDLNAKYATIDSERARLASELAVLPETVIFEDRVDHYPARLASPDSRWFLIDFEGQGSGSALRAVQRDVGRSVSRFYPEYPMKAVEQLTSSGTSRFVLVPYRVDLADEASPADIDRLRIEYPGFRIERLARRVFLLESQTVPAASIR